MTRAKAIELGLLTLLAAIGAASVPLTTGSLSWSWDALNHHVYLGLIAQSPRWNLDVIPASYQSYQYPYLYWPVYLLARFAPSGSIAGGVWSALQAAMVLPPVWLVCEQVVPPLHSAIEACAARVAGCLLAVMSVVVLVGLETTANDLLACVPLLWAVAFGLRAPGSNARAFVCAALWGVSVAFKLSNGLYIVWLVLWWWVPQAPHWPPRRALQLLAGATAGFTVAYAPWGWQLWKFAGNPFYPYFGFMFSNR